MSGSCEALPGKFPPRVCRRMLRIFVFCVAATAPAVTSRIGEERVEVATERVNAALDGLQKYFFDAKGQFWNAVCSHCSNVVCRSGIPVALLELLTLLRCAPFAQCGQNGGNGGKDPTNFTCTCESESPYCKNCFRWWMSTTMQSLMSLNEALPGHTSFDLTMQQLDGMRKHSPYTSRALPSWAYIDDYLWYVLMWMHSYQWHGETGDLQDAANTMELSARTEVAPLVAIGCQHSFRSHALAPFDPLSWQWRNGVWTTPAAESRGCFPTWIHARTRSPFLKLSRVRPK